jgi:lipopolysaccharide cholinephosphotransferase
VSNMKTTLEWEQLFPDEREKGETRLKQCQMVMLRMLKIVHYLCEQHNIEYFMVGGSLLGAIRHKGFIPWDDDLDIGMTRKNYEKFVKVAVPELPNDVFFQTPETDAAFPSCMRVEARLRDKYSTYSPKANQQHYRYHMGLQLDIFVYDRAFLPGNYWIFLLNRSLMMAFWKIGPNNRNQHKRTAVLKTIEKLSPVPLVYASTFICQKPMVKMGTNYIKKEELKSLEKVQFEDMQVYIPVGWHACLERQYGNYMQLPPQNKQIPFHGQGLPDPFNPCNHEQILYWHDRKAASSAKAS